MIGRPRPALPAAALLAAAAWVTSSAPALGDAGPPGGAPPTLHISVVGAPEELQVVRDLVERRLGALGPTVWSRLDSLDPSEVLRAESPGIVSAWIDLRDRSRARLTFAAWSGERFLVRDLELADDLGELDRAALAEVLELSIEALVENERAGLSRREAEALLASRPSPRPASPSPSPTPSPMSSTPARSPLADAPAAVRQGTQIEIAAFYAAEAQAVGLPLAHGPGIDLALSTELNRAPSGGRRYVAAWLSAQYHLPETVRGEQAGVTLDGVAARAGLEAGRRRVRVRLGAGLDFVHVTPEPVDPAVALAAARWSSSLSLTAAARVAVYRGRGLRVWASLLADFVPAAADYGVKIDGTFSPVFTPWRFRPGASVELSVP